MPIYQERLIFPPQEKHVHSSCIVEGPSGEMLACWFHGSGERRSPDVVVQGARLRQGEESWSSVFPMAETPGVPDCNPVLWIDGQGELWLFWIAVLAQRWEDSLLRFRKAREYQEDGPPRWYWQDDLILDPGERFVRALETGYAQLEFAEMDYGAYSPPAPQALVEAARDLGKRQKGWMTRNHVLTLPSGRLLLPLYSDGFYVGLMAISDDGGASWRASEPIVGVCLNQPSVVQKRDGTLVAYLRREGPLPRRVQVSESHDEGETWTVARATELPNPNASLEVIALADGRWVMVYNDVEVGRDSLALALSEDEGASWQWQRHLERLPGGQFHYPSLMQASDGLLHLTYTYQPGAQALKAIKQVVVDTDWIQEGERE